MKPHRVVRLVSLLTLCVACVTCGDAPESGESRPDALDGRTEEVSGAAETSDASRFLGLTHPPIPDGVEKRAGALATDEGESAADTEYGFQDVIAPSGRWLWLSHLEGEAGEVEGLWRVVDAVPVDALGEEERLVIHGCSALERAVAAVVTIRDGEVVSIRRAWSVDAEARALREADAAAVECALAGFSGSPERDP